MGIAAAGALLGERYALAQRIAAGGMGEVWRATDQVLGREVAVKVVRPELTDEAEFRSRFRHEARLAARLSHGNVAQVYDFGEDRDTAYLVMELVDGRALSDMLTRGPVPAAEAVRLVGEAADGLAAAHELGMVHRDVKPANLLLTRKGTVKVTDFGIARALGDAKVTRTGEVVGTAPYLAPEAAQGFEADSRSDVYSLAIVAYELLCGYRPFQADSAITLALKHINEMPPPLPPEVPYGVAAAVLRGLAKHPGQRPNGSAAFARELRLGLGLGPRSAMPLTATAGNGAPPISAPQNVSSTPPALLGRHVGSAADAGYSAAPVPSQGTVARCIAWVWVGAAVLTALCCLLPFAQYGGQSWPALSLAEPANLAQTESASGYDAMGWLLIIPMLLVGSLGLPAALGRPHVAWPLVTIPGCLWSTLAYLACLGAVTTGTGDQQSPVSATVGAYLIPLLGTATLIAVVAAAFKRR